MADFTANPDLPTTAVTGMTILSTGGAFTVLCTDARPTGDGFEQTMVEVARLRINPATLLYLEQAIARAKAAHESIFGKLPDAAALKKTYGDIGASNAEWTAPPKA
jgi:hypothetical protein